MMGQEYRGVFDRDFDLEIEEEIRARRRAEERKFTEDDLEQAVEAARAQAWADGHEAGRQAGQAEEAESLNARQTMALEAMQPDLQALLGEIDGHHRTLEAQLQGFVLAVYEKVLPEVLARTGQERALDQVRQAMEMTQGLPQVRLRVSPATLENHGDTIRALAAQTDAGRHLSLEADPALDDGAISVRWDNGFMDYSFETICAAILALLRGADGVHTHRDMKKAV